MIALDTCALVRALCGDRSELEQLEKLVRDGERLQLPSLVLYEWRRGPRSPRELELQELLFPSEGALVFDARAALLAADTFRALGKPRRRAADIAIAATAISANAALWTLNRRDFEDVPDLELI